jgi:hypothetical protein
VLPELAEESRATTATPALPELPTPAVTLPDLAQEAPPAIVTPVRAQLLPPEATPPGDSVTWSDRASGVILQSIFGKPDPDTWQPLPISTLFSEGWLEPWVPSPNGTGGAPRQDWINAADGNMYRLWFFTFSEGFNYGASNGYLGAYTVYTPLSRRLELITNIPFVVANNASNGLPSINPPGTGSTSHSQTTFGDVSFTPRVLLHETQDFSVTVQMTVVTPTGSSPLQGHTDLIPEVAFWNNFAGTWVIRGGIGYDIPLRGGGTDTLITQFAIGQTLTGHDVPVVGDFTYYLSADMGTPLSGNHLNSLSLTPGIRTHLGHDWYFLAGLPTPLTKERVADVGMIFWFMKAW